MNDVDQELRIQHEEQNGKGAFFIEMEGSRMG